MRGGERREEEEVEQKSEFSQSMRSSVSMASSRSDATLSADEDADTVIDDNERRRSSEERRGRSLSDMDDTLDRDRSVSSVTLKSERLEEGEGEGGERGESTKFHMSVAFRQELLNTLLVKTDSRVAVEVGKLCEPGNDSIQLLGRCLPHIVPNVILAKREVRVASLVGKGLINIAQRHSGQERGTCCIVDW